MGSHYSVGPQLGAALGAEPLSPRFRVMGGNGIRLTIVSARDLRDVDWLLGAGKSDPYVQVEVVGRPHTTFKTPVRNNTKDPVWNFTHAVQHFAAGDALKFPVYDSDPLKSDDILGRATLVSEQFFPTGLAGEIKLDDAGKN